MGKKDARVDAYIAKAQPFAKPIMQHLRALVHAHIPDVEETVKWGFPCFLYKGMFANMAAFKAHVSFGFWKGALVAERSKVLPRKGQEAMGQFGRLASVDDLPSDAVMVKLFKIAMALNDDGVKVVKKKTPKAEQVLTIPPYFTKALKANAKAKATFDAFPYSCRKEYVAWVTEAKAEATRDRRLAQAVEWMAEGKRRNWKYENC